MKKTLLSLTLLSIPSLLVLANDEPTTVWANLLIGKPGQDQATSIVSSGSNEIYWMLTDGSTTDDKDVTYAGSPLYEGASYDGNGGNKNLTLLKTNAAGEKQWCVYSAWGDFAANDGGLAVTPEGNIIFAGTVRHTDGYLDHPVTIVDATGKSTELDWSVERRWYRMILGEVSSEGELQWVRTYDLDNSPVPAATGSNAEFTANALTTGGVCVDDEGNIFVCGNFRTDFTFPKADGTNVILHPRNVTGWSGDSQNTVGSLFLVKLDNNGYYLSHLEESGDNEITASYLQNLEWEGGKLYAYGYLKGTDNKSVKIGGVELTPTEYVSPIVGVFDNNLDVDWIKCFPGAAVGGKNAVQNVGITVSGGNIWLAGQYNGRISDPDNDELFVESTQGNIREGFIIKLSDSGEWLSSADSRTDWSQTYLTGYFKVIVPVSDPDNVYVYGYAMNASVGVFLRCYNKETLVGDVDNSWNIVTKGGVPTCQNIDYVPETGSVYVTVRGNQAFLPIGSVETENPGGYSNLLARFDLPSSFSTGVGEVSTISADELNVAAKRGCLEITNGSHNTKSIAVFDLTGRKVAQIAVAPGSKQTIELSSGLYIVEGKKIVVM